MFKMPLGLHTRFLATSETGGVNRHLLPLCSAAYYLWIFRCTLQCRASLFLCLELLLSPDSASFERPLYDTNGPVLNLICFKNVMLLRELYPIYKNIECVTLSEFML